MELTDLCNSITIGKSIMAKVNRYSKEFKPEAVKLVTEQGYSYSKAERDLGISTVAIRDWVLKLYGSPESHSVPVITPEAKMRKEVKQLKMENEILKNATTLFTRESL